MKKFLLFGFIGWALLHQSPAFGQDEATKPAYKSGESWLYTGKQGGSILYRPAS